MELVGRILVVAVVGSNLVAEEDPADNSLVVVVDPVDNSPAVVEVLVESIVVVSCCEVISWVMEFQLWDMSS